MADNKTTNKTTTSNKSNLFIKNLAGGLIIEPQIITTTADASINNSKLNLMKSKNSNNHNRLYPTLFISQPKPKSKQQKQPQQLQPSNHLKNNNVLFYQQQQQQQKQQPSKQPQTQLLNYKQKFLDDDDSAIGMSEKQPLIEQCDNYEYDPHHHHQYQQQLYHNQHYHHHHHHQTYRTNLIESDYGYNNDDDDDDADSSSGDSGDFNKFNQSSSSTDSSLLNHYHRQKRQTKDKKMLSSLDEGKRTTNLQTLMHIMKANIGTGILALPSAFMNAGLYVGLVSLPILCALCTYCMHILVRANNILSERLGTGKLEYQDLASNAFKIGPKSLRPFSPYAGHIVNLFLLITQIGFCCVYSLFVAENISQFFNELLPVAYHHKPIVYLGFFLPLFILLSFVKSLRHLSLASSMANLLQTVGLLIVMIDLVQDLPNPNIREPWGTWKTYPLFLGTAIYAFEGIGLILPLQKEMKSPQSLQGCTGVLNQSMTLVALTNLIIGFFGYLKYGDAVKGSITLNLPSTPLYQSCKVIFALAIFLSYAIQFYVPVSILWPSICDRFDLKIGAKRTDILENVFRSLLVVFTLALAAAIPKLDLFISLVGAISSSGVALIFPPIIDICVSWDEYRGFKQWTWIFIRDGAILLLGIAGFTTGTYASLENIIEHFND